MIKKILYMLRDLAVVALLVLTYATRAHAQSAWPEAYGGVMLQGFYWDSYDATRWTNLEKQAEELGQYFDLVWLPQSANCGGLSMGYDDLYWFTNYNSSFGTRDELTSLIKTFKNNGISTIADVVINHRKNVSNWVDFPAETYNGVTYQLQSTDICANDDAGATKEWAEANGYSLSSNNDTGEGWDGMRDLDHKSDNVQTNVKAYLSMLLNDLGYAGFRYDMVKGYSASFTALYNAYARPTFSVGEYWDGNRSTVENWINGTKSDGVIQSAAFDFPFRYTVRDAVNNGNWSNLANGGVVTDEGFNRYAVTFVENHDTEYRSATSQQDPIRKDTLAANAFMLAMPGTPCVFLKHWIDCKRDIKTMINARKLAGITNTSTSAKYTSASNYYGQRTNGTRADLLAIVGTGARDYTPTARWIEVASGYHYRYFISKNAETAWIDLPSGTYQNEQQATLTAISQSTDVKLVYTTDGTEPTANSTQVASGTTINIPLGTTTLKAALLNSDGTLGDVITRQYVVESFQPYTITVYVNTDQVGWSSVNFWTWGGDGTHAPANTSWPGDKMSSSVSIAGKNWFSKSYTINATDDYVNFVFSTNSGSPQTVDINNISQDTYFEITTTTDDQAHHYVNDVTSTYTAIRHLEMQNASDANASAAIYDLQGRLVAQPNDLSRLPKGIYIKGGKKIVVK